MIQWSFTELLDPGPVQGPDFFQRKECMSVAKGELSNQQNSSYQVSDKILTIPNVVSFVRLCLVPLYLVLLFDGRNVAAAIVFGIAAGSDFIDGQIARRTNSVSKLGQLLDPAVDRVLMISGVLGVCAVGRVPLWAVVFIVARDLYLLYGGVVLTFKYHRRVPVIFAGKVATTLLFVGFGFLLLNMPQVTGLAILETSLLPGFNASQVSIGIWFVYAGLFISLFTTAHYIYSARKLVAEEKALMGAC